MKADWKKIEEAPVGEPVMICGGSIIDETVGTETKLTIPVIAILEKERYWCPESQDYIPRWSVCDCLYYVVWVKNPTHFMELPEPPPGVL